MTSDAETVSAPRIPPPANFPVHWERPEDEQLFWAQDRFQAPEPLRVMDAYLLNRVVARFDTLRAAFDVPLRMEGRRINGYWYWSSAPSTDDPSELQALAESAQIKLEQAAARLDDDWQTLYETELLDYWAGWEAFDLEGASMPQLLAHWEETLRRWERAFGDIHWLVFAPAFCAVTTFDDLCRDLFGPDEFTAQRLLQGFGNKTVALGRALWSLSREALADDTVARVFRKVPADEVVPALKRSNAGQGFLKKLDAFLLEYGRRGNNNVASVPSWREDPTPVVASLKAYVARPEQNLDEELEALVAERERTLAEARKRLEGYPQNVRERFEALLPAARRGNVHSEEHQFLIDYGSLYYVRRVLLEFGRRFAAAGVLAQADDVFHLSPHELRETAEQLPTLDRRKLAGAREAEIAYFRTIEAPPVLGTPPSLPFPDTPFFRGIAKVTGTPPAPEDGAAETGEVRGIAASPGTARGVARVVKTLAEAADLQPGEILVTTVTAPSWTPLFATLTAVVTETGGLLSHSAIVAREYGIPAVVGTGNATSRIHSGQEIEVDGSAGRVRILG